MQRKRSRRRLVWMTAVMGVLVLLAGAAAWMREASRTRVLPLPRIVMSPVFTPPPHASALIWRDAYFQACRSTAYFVVREDAKERHFVPDSLVVSGSENNDYDNRGLDFYVDYGKDKTAVDARLHHLHVHVRNYPLVGTRVTWEVLPDEWASIHREHPQP